MPSPAAPEFDHAAKRTLVLALLAIMFLATLDVSIIGPTMATIGGSLGDAELLPWIVTAYMIASTVSAPLIGKLSDSHGRRVMLLLSLGIFLGGSTLCAVAPSMLVLVLGRAVQGIGGGGLLSLVQAAIADVVPPRERGRYQAYVAGSWAISGIAGPVLGGLIADHLHWSVIFWINLPLGLGAIAFSDRLLRRLPFYGVRRRLDLTGSLLLVFAATALLLALNWGGQRYAWSSPQIIGLLVAVVATTAVLVLHLRRALEPLLPPRLMVHPVAMWAMAGSSLGSVGYYCLLVYLPIYFETVHGYSPSAAGVLMVWMLVGSTFGAWQSARLSQRLVHYKRPAMAGIVGCALLCATLALFGQDMAPLALAICLVLIGIGLGTVFPIGSIALQNAIDRRDLGIGTAAINFFRSLLGALGVALAGTLTAGVIGGVIGGGQAHHVVAVAAFANVFWMMALTFAASLACFVKMPELPLRG